MLGSENTFHYYHRNKVTIQSLLGLNSESIINDKSNVVVAVFI